LQLAIIYLLNFVWNVLKVGDFIDMIQVSSLDLTLGMLQPSITDQ